MEVVFRADASVQIGTGHVMRCLTLADELRGRGALTRFVCRNHVGHLANVIRDRGHQVFFLDPGTDAPAMHGDEHDPVHSAWLGASWSADAQQTLALLQGCTADWLVVDHYALEARWERAVHGIHRHLMVIDDLADRTHACDVLLDQNLGRQVEHYKRFMQGDTLALIGPRYALLRPEFRQRREASLARRLAPKVERILISMGGVDSQNVSEAVLQALARSDLPHLREVLVVLGPTAPHFDRVQSFAVELPWPTRVLRDVRNMAELMAASDLAIGAAGSSSWERCCMGLPTVVVVLASNQVPGARALADSGAVRLLASANTLESELPAAMREFQLEERLRTMSESATRIADGDGAARVADAMFLKSQEFA